jgi:hypothetical protein
VLQRDAVVPRGSDNITGGENRTLQKMPIGCLGAQLAIRLYELDAASMTTLELEQWLLY